jgi:DNA processing protein
MCSPFPDPSKLVETTQDILEEFAGTQAVAVASRAVAVDDVDPASSLVLQAMGHDPIDADTLATRCALDVAALAGLLLTLELAGRIELLPGAQYRRLA